MWPYFAGVLALTALELPLLTEPVISELDSHLHTGLPALLLAKMGRLAGLLVTLAGTAVLILSKRVKGWPSGRSLVVLAGLFAALNMYGVLLVRSGVLERLGDVSLIHRYPPMGKTLFFAGYSLLGIHEWVGRAIQLGFVMAGAWVASGIPMEFGRKRSLTAFLLYLFLPPFNNIIYLNHLSGGTVFFATCVIALLARCARDRSPGNLLALNAVLCAALLYKRLAVAYVACSFLFLLYLAPGKAGQRVRFAVRYTIVPALFFAPSLVLDKVFGYSPSAMTFSRLVDPSALVRNFGMIPEVVTPSVFWVFLLCVAYLLAFRRTPYTLLLLLWFLVCYILITITEAFGWVRHTLFFYPSIVLCVASALDYAGDRKRAPLRVALVILMVVMLAGHSFFSESSRFFTYRNSDRVFLPYDEAFAHFAEKMPDASVYAPAICEPSHFYIAKHRLSETIRYGREIWASADDQTAVGLAGYMAREGYDYLLLPTSEKDGGYGLPFASSPWLRSRVRWDLVKRISAGAPEFERVAVFTNRKARLELFRLTRADGRVAPSGF
jgi:hypothetical protein